MNHHQTRKFNPPSGDQVRRWSSATLRTLAALAAALVLGSTGSVDATPARPASAPALRRPATGDECTRMAAEWLSATHGSVGDPQGCFTARQQRLLRCFGSAEALRTWAESRVGDPQGCYLAKPAVPATPR